LCDWDASSLKPGPSRNIDIWHGVLAEIDGLAPPVVLNRRLGELIPAAVTSCALAALDAGELPMLLGGDHRLTYSMLQAVTHRVAGIEVHHFDAHHDAHFSATLNNFSVFRFAADRLRLPVVRYGCREKPPGTPLPALPASAAGGAYVTIDLDYLDPVVLSSVSFPVPVPAGMTCTPATLTAQVAAIGRRLPIAGCDVLEWCGHLATAAERQVVITIIRALAEAAEQSQAADAAAVGSVVTGPVVAGRVASPAAAPVVAAPVVAGPAGPHGPALR
jgi:arginase family enzyme